MVDLKVTSLVSEGNTLEVEALVLPKIASVLPSHPVLFNHKWEHLVDMLLADLDFGTPRNVDLHVLLGADGINHAVLKFMAGASAPWEHHPCLKPVSDGYEPALSTVASSEIKPEHVSPLPR